MIDIGPPLSDLVTLAGRVADRLVAEEAAVRSVQTAQQPFTFEELSASGAFCLSILEEHPEDAYYFCRLALALAEATWGKDRHSLWWQTADLYVDVTRSSLLKAPRKNRLDHALETAQEQIRILKDTIGPEESRRRRGLRPARRNLIAAETKELADTLLGAGWLLAGPYCTVIDPDDVQGSFTQWLAPYRLECTTHYNVVDGELAGQTRDRALWNGNRVGSMPDPAQALQRAMAYLDESLDCAPPSLRQRCQIKRSRVLTLLARIDPEHGQQYRRQAVDALEDGRHTVDLNGLQEFLQAMVPVAQDTGPPRLGPLGTMLPFPLRRLREIFPPDSALGILADLTVLADDQDLPQLWDEIHALSAGSARLPVSPRFWSALAHRIPENLLDCPREPVSYATLIPDVRVEREGVPARARAATLVHAALHVTADGLADVIELLDHLSEVDEGFTETYAEMADYVLMRCRLRYADHLTAQGDHHGALLQYVCAIDPAARFAARHTMPGLSTSVVNRSVECVARLRKEKGDLVGTIGLLDIAAPVVTGIVGAIDHHATFVYGLGQHIMSHLLASAHFPADAVAQHQLLFKGFDSRLLTLNCGPRPLSPIAADMHEKIAALEAVAGPYLPDRLGFLDDNDDMPSGTSALFFVSGAEIRPADHTEPSIESYRRVADREITRYLIHRTYGATAFQPSRPEELELREHIAKGLDDDTVLISLYLAERKDSAARFDTVTWIVSSHLTRENVAGSAEQLDLPGPHFTFMPPDRESAFTVHWATLPVARIREDVNEDALGHPITVRGAQSLEEHYARLGGPAEEMLRSWRSTGKRHLCFWPHGPLHFVPFHLLHLDGHPLADDWVVTTLSSSAQLGVRAAPVRRSGRALIVGSAAGGVPFGLPEEPQLTEHVHVLRTTLPDARLIEEATPRKVIDAVADITYLHIAAHGSQDAEAPWHQCLYLTADQDNDGRLFAHQILALDLRGVELVTLSACESALGRYDTNDNHRGLPAAFLLAGAATVIGALWPVRPPVATLFFEELYALLRASHPKRDAFHHAQRITRQSFPAYRDWGAFVLIGRWR